MAIMTATWTDLGGVGGVEDGKEEVAVAVDEIDVVVVVVEDEVSGVDFLRRREKRVACRRSGGEGGCLEDVFRRGVYDHIGYKSNL